MKRPITLHLALAGLAGASLWAQMRYRIPGHSAFVMMPRLGPVVAGLGPLLLVNAVAARIAAKRALLRAARYALAITFLVTALALGVPDGALRVVIDPTLMWCALVVGYLLVIIVIADLISSAAPAVVRRALPWVERVAVVLVGMFVIIGAVAFVNGRFDTSPVREVKTQIRDLGWAEVELDQALQYRWADLRSWRRPEGIERIFVSRSEWTTSWRGQAIVLRVRNGALGLPWVVGFANDLEAENRRVLAISPNARAARADLIAWYLDRRQWPEATAETLEYLERFPAEFEYVRNIAAKLSIAHQNMAARQVLEPLAARHPTPAILGLTGWVVNLTGDRQRSIALLERAIRLDREDWVNYLRLGNVYQNAGRYDDAIATFEQMLRRRPDFPEVERQLTWLRAKLKQRASFALIN